MEFEHVRIGRDNSSLRRFDRLHTAVAPRREIEHLIFESVRRERPAMAENDRLPVPGSS